LRWSNPLQFWYIFLIIGQRVDRSSFFSISSMKVFPCTSVENQHQPSPSDHQTKTDCSCFICICKASLYALLWSSALGWLCHHRHRNPVSHLSLSLSHSSLLISPTFENMTANWKARFRIRNPSRINKFTWRRVFLSISYKHDMLTWILTQPYQQDPKNVAGVDLDFSLVAGFFS
jgi:hypothetical protein